MKFRLSIIAAVLAIGATAVQAGDFQPLATTPVNNIPLVTGANNSNTDKLYIEALDITFDSPEIPGSIDYRAFKRVGSTNVPTGAGTLTLLASRYTPDFVFSNDPRTPIGDLYDFVFRDSRDSKLVFGTRVRLGVSADQSDDSELNFLYRYGFSEGGTTFSAAAAWLFTSDGDLRMYNAGRTASNSLTGAPKFDADTIRFQSDINLSEGNPYSGLFLVKTDAKFYRLADKAVGFFQAGEEGQAKIGNAYAGFAPSAVPEPSTYALMAAGIGAVAWSVRRRRQKA